MAFDGAAELAASSSSAEPAQALPSLLAISPLAAELAQRLNTHIEQDVVPPYHELLHELGRLSADCKELLAAFPSPKTPTSIPAELDVTGTDTSKFSVATARQVIGPLYTTLRGNLKAVLRKKDVTTLEDRRAKIAAGIERYDAAKKIYDTRVTAGYAAAIVALRALPDKKNTVIRGVMDGTKVRRRLSLVSAGLADI